MSECTMCLGLYSFATGYFQVVAELFLYLKSCNQVILSKNALQTVRLGARKFFYFQLTISKVL